MINKTSVSLVVDKCFSGEWGNESVDGVYILRTTNFGRDGNLDLTDLTIREVAEKKVTQKQLKYGDIIIEKSGGSDDQPVGRVMFFDLKDDNKYLCNNFTSTLRISSSNNPKYVFYMLRYLYSVGITNYYQNKTTGIRNLRLERYLNEANIPLPTIELQSKIVEILDQAEEIKKKREETIRKLDELKKSIFFDMFGDPVKNNKKWRISKLGEALDFMTSGSRGWAKYYSDTGSLFLTIKNVGNNELLLDEKTYVNAPDSAEAQRTKVKVRDILLSITADLGRTAVVEEDLGDAHINQHLAILRLKDNYSSVYMSEYLSSVGGKHQIGKRVKGASKDGLNFNDIRSIEVPIPPLELQKKYLEYRNAVLHTKDNFNESLEKSNYLLKTLLQKAFNGELILN
jgi:type I restriction enzyme S subunit